MKTIQDLVRNVSLKRARQLSWMPPEASVRDLSTDDSLVYGHWLSFILLWGESASLVFSVHFSVASAALVVGLDESSPPGDVKDAMKEYCNLTGGYLRNVFDRAEVPLGLSLPTLSSGFDQVWFRSLFGKSSTLDGWVMEGGSNRLICTSDVTVSKPDCVERVLRAAAELEREGEESDDARDGRVEVL